MLLRIFSATTPVRGSRTDLAEAKDRGCQGRVGTELRSTRRALTLRCRWRRSFLLLLSQINGLLSRRSSRYSVGLMISSRLLDFVTFPAACRVLPGSAAIFGIVSIRTGGRRNLDALH